MLTDSGNGSDTLLGGAGNDSIDLIHYGDLTMPAETIRIEGGIGDDRVNYTNLRSGTAAIDLGDGADMLTLTNTASAITATLGTGRDTVRLNHFDPLIGTLAFTDFAGGTAGDVMDFSRYLSLQLTGWNGSNPFGASGYLRLVQSGANTLLQVDADGASGTAGGFATLATFTGSTAAQFTAANFIGYAPDGSPAAGATITGTSGADKLTGTLGDDTIDGLAGVDQINGGDGNDLLYGGADDDWINGDAGSDLIDGGDGNDTLMDYGSGSDTLRGSAGNDVISFSHYGPSTTIETIRIDGGIGDDIVNFRTADGGAAAIDLGDGADKLVLGSSNAAVSVALGAGQDTVKLDTNAYFAETPVVADFVTGAEGDTMDLGDYLSFRTSNSYIPDPFGAGYLRLAQAGRDTLLQVDQDGKAGTAYGFATLLTFKNTVAAQFTASNFNGFAPGSPATINVIAGTAGADTLHGTMGNDLITAGEEDDRVYLSQGQDSIDGGGGSNDRIYLTTNDSTLFATQPTDGVGYIFTASRATNSTGALDSAIAGFEFLDVWDHSGRNILIDAGKFGGQAQISLGYGNHDVIGSAYSDNIVVGGGINTIDAGAGVDTVQATINNDAGMATVTSSGNAVTVQQGGATVTTIRNAESIILSGVGDGARIDASGVSVNLQLEASNGSDSLIGGFGSDRLLIRNGGESDTLKGNAGVDTFAALSFATMGTGTRITDFAAFDVIDFASVRQNEGFTPSYIGTASFSGVPGQYRSFVSAGQTIVQADRNGDKVADATLTIANGAFTLRETAAGSNILSAGIQGTTSADTLKGTTGDDTIVALAGNDIIYASAGHDTIDGGLGADRIRVTPNDSALFAASSVAESYTLTTSRLTNGSGTLDTDFTSIERVEITDLRNGPSTVNVSGFTGNTSITLGDGNHKVTGARGSDSVTLGIGSSMVDGGDNPTLVTVRVDGSLAAPTIVTGTNATVTGGTDNGTIIVGGSYTSGTILIDYASAGGAQHTSLVNAYPFLQSGAAHGLFVDASNAPMTYATSFQFLGGTSSTAVHQPLGVGLIDSAYDDVEIGSRYDDIFSSAAFGASTVNGGVDTLLGSGGRDYFDYEFALQNLRDGHILDFDSDDQISGAYYSEPATPGVEPLFIGIEAFSGGALQIRYETHDGKTYVQTDVNGDRVIDGTLVIESGEYQLVGTDVAGNGGNATLRMATSQNMVTGTNAAETLTGTAGADIIRGYEGADIIAGGDGNDLIDGGKGTDTLHGGRGDDTYLVDRSDDVILEAVGEGIDNVLASADYVLSANLERLTLTGTGNLSGTGHALANTITGNAGDNLLIGGGGGDRLMGEAGDDTLVVSGGKNEIDGGAGSDTLVLSGTRASYSVIRVDGQTYLLGDGQLDRLSNVEQVRFADGTVSFADTVAGAKAFDALSYIASYDDLRAAFGTNAETGARHYLQYGIAEGRAISFDALRYLASNPDLIGVFGTDIKAAERHYIDHGAREGRSASFDPLLYGASNPDLARAFGDDPAALTRHYVEQGYHEGRSNKGTFDPTAYLLSNADLQAARLGSDGALHHWLRFGANEGRGGDAAFGREQTSHALSATTSTAAAFEVQGDHDWFRLDATTGQRIELGYHAALDGVLELHRSDGSLVAVSHAGTKAHDQVLDFTADASDSYYLVVASTVPSITGSYNLDLHLI